MQLNRNSGIVRYWRRVTWWMNDAAKAKALGEGTNLCAFAEAIVIGTTTTAYWSFMAFVVIPITWFCSSIAIVVAACWGRVPTGWRADIRDRWMFPAVCLEWKDCLHLTIRGRKLYPWHALSAVAFAVAGYTLVELWTMRFAPALKSLETTNPSALGILMLVAGSFVTILALAMIGYAFQAVRDLIGAVRSSDAWHLARAWAEAKKDRVCPRIEFIDTHHNSTIVEK